YGARASPTACAKSHSTSCRLEHLAGDFAHPTKLRRAKSPILRATERLVTLGCVDKKTIHGRHPMRTLLATSLTAALLASVSVIAEAGTITGTVKNADGTPFRAAFVRVQNVKTHMTMMVASDRDGRYFTDELAPGAYQVWATAVGYRSEPARRVSVTVDEKGRQTVDFKMQTSAV